jgi:TonB family protein
MIFLKQETFFSINRWYLLATLFASIVIPFLPALFSPQETAVFVATIEPVAITIQDLSSSLDKPNWYQFHWTDILFVIYITGVIIQLIRFGKGAFEIMVLFQKGKIIQTHGLTLVLSETPHLPFSFFRTLFLYKGHNIDQKDLNKIICHEAAHADQWHSIDVLFVELVGAFLWLNPMIYFYRKSLREIHEYLADAAVLQSAPVRSYGKLLLTQSQSGLQMALANQFFQSQLKNRIKMMTRKRSSNWAGLKYLAILPILLFTLSLFSFQRTQEVIQEVNQSQVKEVVVVGYPDNTKKTSLKGSKNQIVINDTIPVNKAITSLKEKTLEIQKEVDEMPRFPGCEGETDVQSRNDCATKKLLQHIYMNIKYPAEAREAGIQGKAVASFVITTGGRIFNTKILDGLGYGIDEEVLRVIESMNDLPDTWVPAQKDGRPVNMEMTIPVKFKLEGPTKNEKEKIKLKGISKEDLAHEKPVIVINGEKMMDGEVGDLNPEEIESVNVVKDLNPELIKKYGEQAKNGIIYIQLKEKSLKSGIVKSGEVFKVVEEMPRFPGCEDQGLSGEELQKCANQKLLQYIYTNLKYPKEAREAGIQGRVVAEFIITKEGFIESVNILRSIGGGADEEVVRVIGSMNEMEERWIPGKQRGKKVNVAFTIPVSFKLDNDQGKKKEKTSSPTVPEGSNVDEVFKVVEQMPRFAGCEDSGLEGQELTKCSNGKLFAYIGEHLKYPEEAKSKLIEGMAVAQFVVRKDGYINDIKIVRSIGAGTDEAVISVLESINQLPNPWIPGMQRGRKVDVMLTLPFSFKLTNDELKNAKSKIDQYPESLQLIDLKIQPNPSSGIFKVICGTATDEPAYLHVFDMKGQQVFSSKINVNGGKINTSIDLSKMESGNFILKIVQGEEQLNTQIRKQ